MSLVNISCFRTRAPLLIPGDPRLAINIFWNDMFIFVLCTEDHKGFSHNHSLLFFCGLQAESCWSLSEFPGLQEMPWDCVWTLTILMHTTFLLATHCIFSVRQVRWASFTAHRQITLGANWLWQTTGSFISNTYRVLWPFFSLPTPSQIWHSSNVWLLPVLFYVVRTYCFWRKWLNHGNHISMEKAVVDKSGEINKRFFF